MIGGRNLFDQPISNIFKTYENIRKISIGQGDDCATGCLLDYTYFKKALSLILKQFNKLIL